MKNIWMLTKANIRKQKSQTVSLFLFVLIAATMLIIGLTVLFGIEAFFDDKAISASASHFTAIFAKGSPADEQGRKFAESDSRVKATEYTEILGGIGEYYLHDERGNCNIIFSRLSDTQKIDAPVFVGDVTPLEGDNIYIPYFMLRGGDYKIGDEFKLQLSGSEQRFTIAGATEEFMFGAQMIDLHRFYISDERYEQIRQSIPGSAQMLLSVQLSDNTDDVFFEADYNKAVSSDGLFRTLILDNAKQSRTMVPVIASIVMTAFAGILLIVCIIVIRFRITNSIEESMTNIGTQKAVGFTNKQIISSVVLQFLLVALLGTLPGLVLGVAAIPLIMSIMEPMIALVWIPYVDISSCLIALLVTLASVAGISHLTARKISKLHPLVALRGGLSTHSFKKNPLPLDKSRGPLGMLLAFKQLLQSKRQAIAIIVIIAFVTMASVACIAVNFNMNEGGEDFAAAFFGEMPDVNFILKNSDDAQAFTDSLKQLPEVRKVMGYETSKNLLINETGIYATVVEDCTLLEADMLIDGRYPKHSNEIALGPGILDYTGTRPGDIVSVKSGDIERDFIITGIVQFINANGFNGIIPEAGLRELVPDFEFLGFNVYLNDDTDTTEFIEKVQNTYTDELDTVFDTRSNVSAMLGSMGDIFGAVAIGIVAVTVLVIALVLYMVIKMAILRRRREFGIQKAVGFTTLQIMNQVSLGMMPAVLAGTVLGTLAGYFGTSPMMGAFMRVMGVVKVALPMPVDQIVVTCIALAALAYIISMLISLRIGRISAYELVSE